MKVINKVMCTTHSVRPLQVTGHEWSSDYPYTSRGLHDVK